MGGDVGHAALTKLHAPHFAQLVRALLLADAVHHKAALGVVDQPEVLVGLGDGHHVHEAHGVGLVGAHLRAAAAAAAPGEQAWRG